MKDEKDKPRKPAPVADPPSPVTSTDDDGEIDDIPDDPEELKTFARSLAKKYGRARRKLERAGLTQDQERTLTGEVAKLASITEEVRSRLAELAGDNDDDDQDESAGTTNDDDNGTPTCPFTIF